MTELMKRFQEETGIDIFGGWTYEIVNELLSPLWKKIRGIIDII